MSKWDLFPECRNGSAFEIDQWLIKEKTKIISVDENSQQTRNRKEPPQLDVGHSWKTNSLISLSMKNWKLFFLSSETRQGWLPFTKTFNIMKILNRTVRQVKQSKDIQFWEIKLFLCVDDMILCGENPKNHMQFKLINSAKLQDINQYAKISCISVY